MRTLILSFHGIGAPPERVQIAERPYWIAHDAFSAFVKGAGTVAGELEIELFATFDDGNRSDLEIAVPLLLENKLRGAFFPCVGRFPNPNYLSPADLRRIAALGFEIGSHGVDHVPWTTLDEANLNRETTYSKKQLEDVLGVEVKSVAVPFGAYNRRVLMALRIAGYRTIYTSDYGFMRDQNPIRRRWTFRVDEAFDIRQNLAKASSISHITITALKHYIKSRR